MPSRCDPEMENIVVPGIGRVGDVQCKLDAWVKKQHPGVEVALVGLASALQGGFLGLAFGYVGNMAQSDPAAAGNPSLAMLSTGGPWKQAAGFGTLMGVNAALNLLIKKARSGKEDVYGA